MVILPALAMFSPVKAEELELSIYEIQHDSDANGASIYDSCNVDYCSGGVVVDKFRRGRVKLTVQDTNDPNALSGWGGIIVKNNKYTVDPNVFDDVNVGDWVSFTKVIVIEDYGNTMLQFEPDSGINKSSGNALPEPIPVSPNDIAAPVYQSGLPEGWFVLDRSAEKYEAMLVRVENVKVTYKDIGAHFDNYVLQDDDDPNESCWASDYMNETQNEEGYHPFVEEGQHFCSVTGIVEQFTGYMNEYDWDYYQLLTTYTGDLKRYTPADLDGDCMVDFSDFAVFYQYWLWGTE